MNSRILGGLWLSFDCRYGTTLIAPTMLVQFVVACACHLLIAEIGGSNPIRFSVNRVRYRRYAGRSLPLWLDWV